MESAVREELNLGEVAQQRGGGHTIYDLVVVERTTTKTTTLESNADLRRCCRLGLPPAGGRSRGGPLPAGGP